MIPIDPQFETLATQLADTVVRNTAASIADRISISKAGKKDKETIAELEEIISGLLSDKSELVRIAQAYEQELVAQQISSTDIEYISTNIVPLVSELTEAGVASNGQDATAARDILRLIQPILSVETVTVLQLIGFNFRQAIGAPLTELVKRLILSKVQSDPAVVQEIQRLNLVRETSYLNLALDAEAYARLQSISGLQQ
jgi:hypothetical protein